MKKIILLILSLSLAACQEEAFAQTQVKISALPSGTTLTGSEVVVGVQGGTTVSIAIPLVKGYVLNGLAAVATSGAYSDLTGKPTFATVATSGAYSDLTGRPSFATVATSGAYSDLSGLPSLGPLAVLTVSGTASTGYIVTCTGSGTYAWAAPTAGSISIGSNATGVLTYSSGVLNFSNPKNSPGGPVILTLGGQLPTGLLAGYINQSGGVQGYDPNTSILGNTTTGTGTVIVYSEAPVIDNLALTGTSTSSGDIWAAHFYGDVSGATGFPAGVSLDSSMTNAGFSVSSGTISLTSNSPNSVVTLDANAAFAGVGGINTTNGQPGTDGSDFAGSAGNPGVGGTFTAIGGNGGGGSSDNSFGFGGDGGPAGGVFAPGGNGADANASNDTGAGNKAPNGAAGGVLWFWPNSQIFTAPNYSCTGESAFVTGLAYTSTGTIFPQTQGNGVGLNQNLIETTTSTVTTAVSSMGIYNPIELGQRYILFPQRPVSSMTVSGTTDLINPWDMPKSIPANGYVELQAFTTGKWMVKSRGALTQTGSFTMTGSSTTAFTVTLTHTMASTAYSVNIQPTSAIAAATNYISAKTTTTFTVTYATGLTGTVSLDWSATPYN